MNPFTALSIRYPGGTIGLAAAPTAAGHGGLGTGTAIPPLKVASLMEQPENDDAAFAHAIDKAIGVDQNLSDGRILLPRKLPDLVYSGS